MARRKRKFHRIRESGTSTAAPPDVEVIDRPEALTRLTEDLRQERELAVDTEFVRERSYSPRLELVQIATRGGRIVLVDYGALGLRPAEDPLGSLLDDSGILKIFHAADQDLEMLASLTGDPPEPVWDTQLALGFLEPHASTGYTATVERWIGIRPAAGEALTDWSHRPLTKRQLRYAAEDVRYLIPLYDLQRRRLAERGRLDWAREECALLAGRVREALHLRADPHRLHERVRGWQRLGRRELGILRELARWRDTEARRQDRLPGRIVRDDTLIELARKAPRSASELRENRTLPHHRLGNDALEAIRSGQDLTEDDLPARSRGRRRLDGSERALVSLLQTVLRAVALREDVSPSLVATSAELEDLVSGWTSPAPRLLHGWRRRLVGEDVRAVMEGRRTLRWDPEAKRLRIQEE